MNTVYHISPASSAQLAAIPRIEQAAARIFPEEDLPAEIRYQVTDAETLKVAQQDGRIWIAASECKDTVGFAMATLVDGSPHLDEIDVLPSHGRRGIGSRLVHTVVQWARAEGYDRLTLVTFRHLPWNGPFYARLGFTPVDAASVGPQMRAMLEQERAVGIQTDNRQVMQLVLR